VAECKIWSGPKQFSESIDQLFGYATWEDIKLALVIFVESRGLAEVIEKAESFPGLAPSSCVAGDFGRPMRRPRRAQLSERILLGRRREGKGQKTGAPWTLADLR
jgi:hypothetical protein